MFSVIAILEYFLLLEALKDSKIPYLFLTLNVPCISESCIEIKIKLNFYVQTLSFRKRFCEGLQGFHKAFWGTTKKCENENLT